MRISFTIEMTYGIGTCWCPGGKHAMQFIIQKRLDLKLIAFGKMKMIDQDYMGKSFKVFKPLSIGRINVNGAVTPCAPVGCMGMPASSLNGE